MKRLSISFILFILFVLIIILAQGLFAQAPTLIYPNNGLTGVSVLPTMRWSYVAGVDSFKLFVDDTSNFVTPIYEENVGTDTFKTFTPLINNFPLNNGTKYWWKVVAFVGGSGDTSSIYHFTTAPAFNLSQNSPSNGQQIQTDSVILQWSLGHSANGLEFVVQYQYATTAPTVESDWSGASSAIVPGNSNSSYSTTISVFLGRTYYWRVLIRRTSNREYVHYPSPTTYKYFVTVGGATVTLTPNWPKDSIFVYSNNPTFNWVVNGYTGGLTYQIRYATSNSVDGNGELNGHDAVSYPSSPTLFPSVQYLTLNNDTLYPGRTYYWQVRAYYSATGQYSNWSSVEDFVVYGPGTLEVPVPNYPVGGVSVYTNTPILNWVISTAGTGLKYQVRYSTSSGTSSSGELNGSDATNYPNNYALLSENKYLTLPSLTPGKTYYWQVRSYSSIIDVLDDETVNGSSNSFSNWSSVASFTTNGPGTLVVPTPNWPTGGITVYTTSPVLTWYLNPYSSGLVFEIDIATSLAGLDGNPDYSSSSMQVQVTGLTPGQTYYWRVRSKNSIPDSSNWSSVDSFTIAGGTTATYAVANWPTGGVTVYTNRPTLSWYLQGYNLGISGFIVKYKKSSPPSDWLSYSPGSNDADGGMYTGLNATTFNLQINVDLTYGETYYWAVYAVGTTTFNSFGQGSFSVVGGPTATTIINNWPYNNSTINQTSLTFTWNVVGSELGIVDYELVYSNSDVFDSSVTITVTGITNKYKYVTGLTNGATYYWKVRARYANNTYTAYSTVTSFTIQEGSSVIIAQPVAASPNNIVLTFNTPEFSWYLPVPVVQSVNYDLEYADNPYFLNSTMIANITSNHITVSSLESNKQYFWRVKAKSSDGVNSYYSNIGRFGIQSMTDVYDRVSNIPKEYALYQNYPNPFNPSTSIRFDLPEATKISLKIYNVLGQEILILFENVFMDAGSYSKVVDLSNLPSGIYFYQISTEKFSSIKKMVLLK